RQALTLADALGMRPLQAHCHRGLGTLYSQIGWAEFAHAELTMAMHLYRTMDMTFWLPQVEAALEQVLRSRNTIFTPRRPAAAARRTAERGNVRPGKAVQDGGG